ALRHSPGWFVAGRRSPAGGAGRVRSLPGGRARWGADPRGALRPRACAGPAGGSCPGARDVDSALRRFPRERLRAARTARARGARVSGRRPRASWPHAAAGVVCAAAAAVAVPALAQPAGGAAPRPPAIEVVVVGRPDAYERLHALLDSRLSALGTTAWSR